MGIKYPEELTIDLYRSGAIGFATKEEVDVPGGFKTLKSGRISPTYVNIRPIISLSEGMPMTIYEQTDLRELVVSSYDEVIDQSNNDYNHIMGIPHAMTALGSMVGFYRRESVLSMRQTDKTYGVHQLIEGNYQPGDTVLPLDDVVTDGGSKFETLDKVKAAGLTIGRFVVLVDREEGGRQIMEQAGLELSAAIGMGEITAILAEQNLINDRQVAWTGAYFQGLVEDGVIERVPSELNHLV